MKGERDRERISQHPPPHHQTTRIFATSAIIRNSKIHSTLFFSAFISFFHSILSSVFLFFLRVAVGILNKWVISGTACTDDDDDAMLLTHPFYNYLVPSSPTAVAEHNHPCMHISSMSSYFP